MDPVVSGEVRSLGSHASLLCVCLPDRVHLQESTL